jgi:hypothetical protein
VPISTVAAQPANPPTSFRDSIALRARNIRFRGIGNPYAFLSEIGLVPIKEYIYRGATILDLADELNLPVTTLRTWIEENGYQGELEEASTLSAEGYIRQGEIMLKAAANKFDLDKAKAMIEHGRWMASKKDKKTYGQSAAELGQQAAVSYTFIVGENSAVQINASQSQPDTRALNQTGSEIKPVTFSLDQTNPFQIDRPPDYLQKTHSDFPAIAPLTEPEED